MPAHLSGHCVWCMCVFSCTCVCAWYACQCTIMGLLYKSWPLAVVHPTPSFSGSAQVLQCYHSNHMVGASVKLLLFQRCLACVPIKHAHTHSHACTYSCWPVYRYKQSHMALLFLHLHHLLYVTLVQLKDKRNQQHLRLQAAEHMKRNGVRWFTRDFPFGLKSACPCAA